MVAEPHRIANGGTKKSDRATGWQMLVWQISLALCVARCITNESAASPSTSPSLPAIGIYTSLEIV